MTEIDYGALDERFRHHVPDAERAELHQTVRDAGRAMAVAILQSASEGRERSLALTRVEEAVMWANAAVARGGN